MYVSMNEVQVHVCRPPLYLDIFCKLMLCIHQCMHVFMYLFMYVTLQSGPRVLFAARVGCKSQPCRPKGLPTGFVYLQTSSTYTISAALISVIFSAPLTPFDQRPSTV